MGSHWAAYLGIYGVWGLRVELMISRRHCERPCQDGMLRLPYTIPFYPSIVYCIWILTGLESSLMQVVPHVLYSHRVSIH